MSGEQGAKSEERVVGIGCFGVGRKAEVTAAKACLLSLLLASATTAQVPFSFDDIQFWVGAGANRAALVIDWFEDAPFPRAPVWGYRWNGTAHGNDMLTAIVAADPRLFAKLGGSPADATAVYGLGYDANADGQFAIDDGTIFDTNGIVYTEPSDLAMASDREDIYFEGWFTGFWHYGVAADNPFAGGHWSDTPVGMASRELTEGAWDSWTFSPTFNFGAFADNPFAAPPPFSPADFNHDGNVDTDDYTLWRNIFDSTSQLAADANRNGIVDAADFVIWRKQLSATESSASSAFVFKVPEPMATFLFTSGLLITRFMSRRNANLR